MKNILVSLDGSELSERSLPWARRLARGGEVTLLRVIEWLSTANVYLDTVVAAMRRTAENYLRTLATTFDPHARVRAEWARPSIASSTSQTRSARTRS